jgi:hypothetical protein
MTTEAKPDVGEMWAMRPDAYLSTAIIPAQACG